jgi:hypothetical protein
MVLNKKNNIKKSRLKLLITTINSIMLLIPIIVNLKFQNIKENIKISSKNLLKIEIIESKFITKNDVKSYSIKAPT